MCVCVKHRVYGDAHCNRSASPHLYLIFIPLVCAEKYYTSCWFPYTPMKSCNTYTLYLDIIEMIVAVRITDLPDAESVMPEFILLETFEVICVQDTC
ncbi:hypothetical protein NPIL_228861 [Nephila pilipes]|uniref:Uncharacterized protein n=1 Tax=Nephila pilipes TaxID=299642 RepID=A0A8X6TQV1_NEPPI|nr:hypothetical protein NPIL_228861 [Nephila pilipes]